MVREKYWVREKNPNPEKAGNPGKCVQNLVPRCINQVSSVEISFNYAPEMDISSRKNKATF